MISNNPTAYLYLRISASSKKKWQALAKQKGITLEDWVIGLLEEEANKQNNLNDANETRSLLRISNRKT